MEDVEERDMALEFRERVGQVVIKKSQPLASAGNHFARLPDFARIDIVSGNGRLKAALAQVKWEETDAATDVEERFGRSAQQLVSGTKDMVAAQFARDIPLEPALWEKGGNAGASLLVGSGLRLPVFHLRRIFGLPD